MASDTLSLPWLRVSVTAPTAELIDEFRSGVRKFAAGTGKARLALRVNLNLVPDSESRGEAARIWALANTRFQFVAGIVGRRTSCYASSDGTVVTLDHEAAQADFWLRKAVFTAPYSTWSDLIAAPLAEHWRSGGCFPLHAAAVAAGKSCLLLVGPSGSGKTSVALALLAAGGLWRADDKVLWRLERDELAAVSLYRNTNLAPDTIARFADLGFVLPRPPIDETNDKRACLLEELPRRVDLSPFTPTAVLFLERGCGSRSRLERVGQVEAMMRLAAQSPTSGLAARHAAQHRALGVLARRLPGSVLVTGTDVLDTPREFAAWLIDALKFDGVSSRSEWP